MPGKKPKLKLVKSKAAPKAKSQIEKKKTAAKKPKLVAKKAEKKTAMKAAPKASGGNIFWKVLEMRRQEREARERGGQTGHYDQNDPRHIQNDKHARFSRYAGPRRRAA